MIDINGKFGKNVMVTDIYGDTHVGVFETYTPAIDTESEKEDEMGLLTSHGLVGIIESEIKTIELK